MPADRPAPASLDPGRLLLARLVGPGEDRLGAPRAAPLFQQVQLVEEQDQPLRGRVTLHVADDTHPGALAQHLLQGLEALVLLGDQGEVLLVPALALLPLAAT